MIRAETQGPIGILTLDRESALNTLNLEMVTRLLAQLRAWETDPAIAVIALRGAGPRSFCSGGDVKSVCLALKSRDEQYAIDFFTNEYRLDHAIHECAKPVLALAHGYVMGGGIGLLAGASCRVVTDSSALAMPELSIGLFPDVGGSYFLQDSPGKTGLFLALTAARITAADAIYAGLADLFVPDAELARLLESLAAKAWSNQNSAPDPARDREKLLERCRAFAEPFRARAPRAVLPAGQSEIDRVLAGHEPRAAFARLASAAAGSGFVAEAARAFVKGSPTSAFLIFEQLRRGQTLSLEACFRMELDLAIQCCRHHDFYEGVRALLIDKDKRPQWRPGRLEDVTPELVLEHFHSPWSANEHPLKNL